MSFTVLPISGCRRRFLWAFDRVLNSRTMVAILIALVVLGTFSRILSAEFVMWDDDIAIYENHHLRSLDLHAVEWAFTDISSTMRYVPLTLINWLFLYNVGNGKPFLFHLESWLLHGVNSLLLFLLIDKILTIWSSRELKYSSGSRSKIILSSAIATLLWSLHPLRVEPVSWATDLSYCQATFFLLLSLLLYLQHSTQTGNRTIRYLASASFFYLLALLSHPLGITFFAIFVVADIFLLKRAGGITEWMSRAKRDVLFEKALLAVPALAIAVVTLVVRMRSAGIWEIPVPLSQFGVFPRFMQATYVLVYYLWRPFVPIGLAPVYTSLVEFDPYAPPFVVCAIIVLATSVCLFTRKCGLPLLRALGISYFFLVLPNLGLLEHPHFHSDRYSLLSSICLSLLIAFILVSIEAKERMRNVALVSVFFLTTLSVLSYKQTSVWSNSVSLFEHTIQVLGNDPYASDIYCRLGLVYRDQGNYLKSTKAFSQALSLDPKVANYYFQLIRKWAAERNK